MYVCAEIFLLGGRKRGSRCNIVEYQKSFICVFSHPFKLGEKSFCSRNDPFGGCPRLEKEKKGRPYSQKVRSYSRPLFLFFCLE